MPAGSAASLPMPQGPLSPSSFARRARFKVPPPAPGVRPLARGLPLRTTTQDPPRRRILVAWNDSEAALQLQRLLVEVGYRVVGAAVSGEEAEQLIAPPLALQPSPHCALVHVGFPDATRVADRLAEKTVPLVWLVPDADAVLPAAHAHAPILDRPFDRAALVMAIEEAERHYLARRFYPVPPPQAAWPRIFPQL